IGIALSLLNSSRIKRTTVSNPSGDGSSFDACDYSLTGSYGKNIFPSLSFGFNLRYISQKIDTFSASGFGGDFGIISSLPIEGVSIGAVIQNIGTKLKFVKESDKQPFNIKAGIGYKLNRANIALDINKPADNSLGINLGGEFWVINNLCFRAGYASSVDEGSGISGGLGIGFKEIKLDYAYIPRKLLNDSHYLSLKIGFGKEKGEKPKVKKVETKAKEIPKTEKAPKTPPSLKPSYSSKLIVYSNPSRAKVYLDNTFQGTTPIILYDLIPQKPYKIKITIDGYKDWEKEFIPKERMNSLRADLIKSSF
ncbi:MAG: PorV/PorQ family protein, partial [bacterium]